VIFSGVAFEDWANPKGPIRATMIHRTSAEDWGRDGIAMTLPYLLTRRFVCVLWTDGTDTLGKPKSALSFEREVDLGFDMQR
jgi:hypothetical protein